MRKNASQYPKFFELQTTSHCNGGCIICPHRDVSGKLPGGIMDMVLFKNIIDQISLRKTEKTRIIPYFNGEPFLDPLIFERLAYIKEKCGDCEIEISTNLSVFDERKQKQLSDFFITDLRLSVFGFTKETYEHAMSGLDWATAKNNLDALCLNKALRSMIGRISLVMVDYPDLTPTDVESARRYCEDNSITFEYWGFLDRGGNVSDFNNNVTKSKVKGCEQDRPLERMHVLFDGRVVLCCMDWRQEYILGDLSHQTVEEVWQSPEYLQIRNEIYGGETAPSLCRHCKLAI